MKRLSMLALVAALAVPTLAHADAWDAAMAQGAAARDRASDTKDPAEWNQALRFFEEADEIKSTADSKFELANAASHLHADAQAYEAYEGAIAKGLTGKAKDLAQAFLAAHEKDIARLDVKGPAGAVVTIQEHRRGVLPLASPIVVFRGKSRVIVDLPNGKRVEREIDADGTTTTSIDVTPVGDEVKTTETSTTGMPRPPLKPARSHDGEWLTIAVGGGVMAASFLTYIVGSAALESKRNKLGENCAVLDGSDGCAHPKPGKTTDAQGTVDAIATWKTVRVGSAVTAMVGLGVAVFGLVQLAQGMNDEPQKGSVVPSVMPTFDIAGGGARLGIDVHF